MNILYVEFNFWGHRLKYTSAFAPLEGDRYSLYYLVPQKEDCFPLERQIVMQSGFNKARSLKTYFAFVREVKRVVKRYKIDVVHILDGDFLYRYFGLGLKGIKAKLIITYHHMELGGLKRLSIKRIFGASKAGVVHTAKLKKELEDIGVKNAEYIDYPMLDPVCSMTKEEARFLFGIDGTAPVLAVVGGLAEYKGFDTLIRALNKVTYPCVLLAAGEPLSYDESYIRENLQNGLVTVKTCLRHLSDEEFSAAVQAADALLFPYKPGFDGASGPLVSAAVHKKVVIGAAHGSLGDIIKTYLLGSTFISGDEASLARAINAYLAKPFACSEEAEKFAARSNVNLFIAKNAALYGK